MTTPQTIQKPGMLTALSILTLISGIGNIFWSVGLLLVLGLPALVTIIFIICIPFLFLPAVLGIFEIIFAAKLLANPPKPMQPSMTLAILEIVNVLSLNVFSVIVGILALVFYNDAEVKNYFEEINRE